MKLCSSSAILICCVLFFAANVFSVTSLNAVSSVFSEEDRKAVDFLAFDEIWHHEERKLCGVNALYLFLKLSGEKDVARKNLIAQFPDVRKNGLTFAQLGAFLDEQIYSYRLLKVAPENFAQMPKGTMAFVLKEAKDKEDLSHTYLLRVADMGKIQIFDFPKTPKVISVSELGKEELFCLFVAKDENKLPSTPFLSGTRLWLSWGVFVLSFFSFSCFVFKKRKKLFGDFLKHGKNVMFLFGLISLALTGCGKKIELPVVLSCKETSFDFGLISRENGIASASHVFTIENSSDIERNLKISVSCSCVSVEVDKLRIPAKGKALLPVSIRLRPEDVHPRTERIVLFSPSKDIKPLEILVHGRAKFIIFPDKEKILFPDVAQTDKETVFESNLLVFRGDFVKLEDFITKVTADTPEIFSTSITFTETETFSSAKETFHLHKGRILVRLNVQQAKKFSGKNTGKLFVEIKMGETLEIPLEWNVLPASVFNFQGNIFFVTGLKVNEKREISLLYNTAIGGEIQNIQCAGEGLKHENTTAKGDFVEIGVSYLTSKAIESDSEIGQLTIKTTAGVKHQVKILGVMGGS